MLTNSVRAIKMNYVQGVKIMKKMISVLLTFALIFSMSVSVFAISVPEIGTEAPEGLDTVGSKVLGYVQWFGYILAIGMLLYLGIKYMMSSANEKADLKKGSINYVIGAILVAGASAVVGVLANIGTAITTK